MEVVREIVVRERKGDGPVMCNSGRNVEVLLERKCGEEYDGEGKVR